MRRARVATWSLTTAGEPSRSVAPTLILDTVDVPRQPRPPQADDLPDGTASPQEEVLSDRAIWRGMLQQTRGCRGRLVLITLLELVAAPLALLAPVPLMLAVDSIIGTKPLPSVLGFLPTSITSSKLSLLMFAGALELLIAALLQGQFLASYTYQTKVGEQLTLGFRSRLFAHIQRLSFAWHERRGSADSMYRIQQDGTAVQDFAVFGVIPIISSAAILAGMAVVTFRIDWQLGLIGLAIAPLLYMMQREYKRRMRNRYVEVSELESAALHVVHETLAAERVVQAFGREQHEHDRFIGKSSQGAVARVRLAFAEGVLNLLIKAALAVGTATVLYIGVSRVLTGGMTLGNLLLVLGYLAMMNAPLAAMSKRAATLQGAVARARRCFELLAVEPEVADRPGARRLMRARGDMEFRGVDFDYEPERPILRDVTLRVTAGSRVGIVGQTGAGKSTLLALINRFYDPTQGSVTLDGVDLRDYRLADLRNQFSLLSQDPVLFSTTIRENIGYGRPEATAAEVEAAAEAAGVHEAIQRLADGYDTVVGERGLTLSGGERQRIALARAFLKDAPILLLDEPTSSVDNATEAQIMSTMDRLMRGRTSFVIAHRLSTLADCDVVLRVADGAVTEVTLSTSGVVMDALETPAFPVAAVGAASRLAGASPMAHLAAQSHDGTGGSSLRDGLRRVLSEAGHDTAGLRFVEQHDDPFARGGTAQIIDCELGGTRLLLRCKRAGVDRGRGDTEPYAVMIHRDLFSRTRLAGAPLVGSFRDDDDGATWVVTEHPRDSWRVGELATEEAMARAAAWLGDFHRENELADRDCRAALRRQRVDDVLAIIGRAQQRTLSSTTRDHILRFTRHVEELVEQPLTAILWEADPGSFVVSADQVYPADIVAVRLGAGELDLMALLDGWPPDVAARCQRRYATHRWPLGESPSFGRRLNLAAIFQHLRALADDGAGSDVSPQWRLDDLQRRCADLGGV